MYNLLNWDVRNNLLFPSKVAPMLCRLVASWNYCYYPTISLVVLQIFLIFAPAAQRLERIKKLQDSRLGI
jgi:hypothetical protein